MGKDSIISPRYAIMETTMCKLQLAKCYMRLRANHNFQVIYLNAKT